MRTITLNEDDMREPCEHNDIYTCGHCNRNWCGTCNPTPSARCPFEYEHEYDPELQWGEESAKFQASLDEDEANYAARRREELLVAEAEEGYDVDKLVPRRLPHIGMSVCYHSDYHGEITKIFGEENPGLVELDNGSVVDFEHCCEPLPHSIEHGPAHPCPVCGQADGFHDDNIHRTNIDPKYLLEKGWHNG